MIVGFDENGVPRDEGGLPVSPGNCRALVNQLEAYIAKTTTEQYDELFDDELKRLHPHMYEQVSRKAGQ